MTMKDCTKLVRYKRTASIAISEMQICILSKTHLHHRDRICDGPNMLAHSIMYFYSVLASPRELENINEKTHETRCRLSDLWKTPARWLGGSNFRYTDHFTVAATVK